MVWALGWVMMMMISMGLGDGIWEGGNVNDFVWR